MVTLPILAALRRRPALRRPLPKAADLRSPNQSALVPDLTLGHLFHEPVEVFLGKIHAHAAQALRYLFANLFFTEGVKFRKRIRVDFLLWLQLRGEAKASYVFAQCGPQSLSSTK